MVVSVDIEKLKNHLAIVHEERRVAETLGERLKNLSKQASVNCLIDVDFIEQQRYMIQHEFECIQRRITLLELMIEEFSELKQSMANTLEEAMEQL